MSGRALLGGFAGLLASAWLFGYLAHEIDEGETGVDDELARWLHSHASSGWTDVFTAITWLGNLVTLAVVLAVAAIFLARRRWYTDLQFLLLAAIGTKVLTEVFKWSFQRDRPFFPDPLASESTYSFPSGHASMSLAVYGSLAIIVARRLGPLWQRVAVLGGAVVLIGLIGFSRLYLGVHFLSDVIAGYALAIAWMTLCALALDLRTRRQTSRYLASTKQYSP
jgi:membrane-associated phospholipid phosphatase